MVEGDFIIILSIKEKDSLEKALKLSGLKTRHELLRFLLDEYIEKCHNCKKRSVKEILTNEGILK